ncbi:LADA_0D03840g1_1 [Lachancea dasiensis]|uniref:LADA_0D03840g1_1 n=1 Tax=Lachancea dasiensis TaxID=1072105 RepID=A0A1G4J560_9SACH|nr:LADA_0D03840g1_1 [Lachancea dasiensis]
MKPEKAYLSVVLVSYIYITVALVTLWKFRHDSSKLYYWNAVLLFPVLLWFWSVISWTGSQIFANAKRD